MRTKAKRTKKPVTKHTVTPDPEAPANKRDRRRAHQRRADRRDELWPGSGAEVWIRTENDGFSTIPRLLPWVTVLLKHLSAGGGDPSSVYVELWARVYDEGYVQVKNETDHAYAAGYSGQRGLRSWRERVRILEDHGFVRIKANGAQQIGHVLLVNPLMVVARLKKQTPGKIPDEWWASFLSRADEVGAVIPQVTSAKG